VSVRIAVFASGGGSNLQALIEHFANSDEAMIALVVSDRAEAGALARAQAAKIPAIHIRTRERPIDDVSADMLEVLEDQRIELIALAGYLKLVPPAVTRKFRDRIMNIHPALLPAFGGKGMFGNHVHAAVLSAGCRVTGATVHHVDDRYDEGSIIAQWPVPVLRGDTVASLAARVLRMEHRLYPLAVAALARRLRAPDATSGLADVFRMAASADGIEAEMSSLAGLE